MRFKIFTVLLIVTSMCSCAQVHEVTWTRIDNNKCQTTKVNPTFYSSETETDCMVDGKAKQITTNHDDISILAGFVGLIAMMAGS